MRDFIKALLFVTNIVSFALVIIFGIGGVIYEILGPEKYERIFRWLNIPWNFDKFFNIGYICLAILIVTYFLRVKLFGE